MKRRFAFAFLTLLIANTLALSGTGPLTGYLALYVSISHNKDSRETPAADPANATTRQPEAVLLASEVLRRREVPDSAPPEAPGGLWLSGDVNEALARLQWIVGRQDSQLIMLGPNGRVRLNAARLSRAAGIDDSSYDEASLSLAAYISANEGLFLLLQLTQSTHHYLLHIGSKALTASGEVPIRSTVNLDNNFDTRISPRRPNGIKFDSERPPEGFDSEVAMNPVTRWVNEWTRDFAPVGQITFHELAEAYAKVELGLDYLRQGSRPGAHEIAMEREHRLMVKRQPSNVVVTGGPYFVLTSEKQIRNFETRAGLR
jgi:hypothetical protein